MPDILGDKGIQSCPARFYSLTLANATLRDSTIVCAHNLVGLYWRKALLSKNSFKALTFAKEQRDVPQTIVWTDETKVNLF